LIIKNLHHSGYLLHVWASNSSLPTKPIPSKIKKRLSLLLLLFPELDSFGSSVAVIVELER
jgi:hypothetical protein